MKLLNMGMGGLVVIMLALVACSTAYEIRTVEDGVAQAYSTVSNLALETVDARAQGLITDDQAQEIKGLLSESLHNLDRATSLLEVKEIGSAESRLANAQVMLQNIIKLMEAHQMTREGG